MGSFAMLGRGNPNNGYGGRAAPGIPSGPGPGNLTPVGPPGPPGGIGGAGGAGGPTGTFTAQTNPALDALQGRYDKYLDNLEGNTGRIMDIAGSRLRDAREGGRTSLQASEALRGVGTSNRMGNYDAATTRGVQGAIADITTQREATLGSALQGGLAISKAPADLALQEKGLQLTAAGQQQQAANQQMQAWLALLNSQRQSPIYAGFGPAN